MIEYSRIWTGVNEGDRPSWVAKKNAAGSPTAALLNTSHQVLLLYMVCCSSPRIALFLCRSLSDIFYPYLTRTYIQQTQLYLGKTQPKAADFPVEINKCNNFQTLKRTHAPRRPCFLRDCFQNSLTCWPLLWCQSHAHDCHNAQKLGLGGSPKLLVCYKVLWYLIIFWGWYFWSGTTRSTTPWDCHSTPSLW